MTRHVLRTLAFATLLAACSGTERETPTVSPCGNAKVDPGEACDKAIGAGATGACPASCDDEKACTADTLEGSASACSATCRHTDITTCLAGDGCCPAGCNAVSDSDCAPKCGNGVVELGETCDGNCPVACSDGNPCTQDVMTGSAGTCDVRCQNPRIEECSGGDGCCPAMCNSNNDNDCRPGCGNGAVETGETCDKAIAAGQPGACPASCNDNIACTADSQTGSETTCSLVCHNTTITACSDGDGCCPGGCNAVNDSDCQPRCGNGIVEGTEKCDGNCPATCNDGSACTTDVRSGSPSSCDVVCTNTPVTACTAGDGCCPAACNANTDTDCSASCGNGAVESGETCDKGIGPGQPGACPDSCADTDACTADHSTGSASTCTLACVHEPITACAGGDGCCPSACSAATDTDCSAHCGNNVVEPGEVCDGNCPSTCNDGNACTTDVKTGAAGTCDVRCTNTPVTACADGDGCCPAGCHRNNDSDCSTSCGNGVVEGGETCDGNCPTSCDDSIACTRDVLTGSAAGCTAACSHTSISDCSSGDGCCPAGCTSVTDLDCSPTCGNSTLETGETCDGNCPSTCNDGDACTRDSLVGSAATCSAQCSHAPIVECSGGDGCCAPGCTSANDSDCAATGPVGAPCSSGGQCLTQACIDEAQYGWTGGYCTAACKGNADCGAQSHCAFRDNANGWGWCVRNCGSNTDCRAPAYQCWDDDADGTVECLPVASGTGAVGAPCTDLTQCGGGADGYCLQESRGFKAGTCTRTCTPTKACPSGSHCTFVDADGRGACLPDCTVDAHCRADGYLCQEADASTAKKECFPAATGPGAVGDACSQTFHCTGGLDGACMANVYWPGGYCTRTCASSAACPSGSTCGYIDDATGSGVCVKACTTDAQCRADGYKCMNGDGVPGNECLGAATGSGAVGDPCTSVGECSGGVAGSCLTSVWWPAGYCSRTCSAGAPCPSGSGCGWVDAATGEGICTKTCTADAQCRADGYRCLDEDGVTATKECVGAAIGTGAVGAACQSIGECAGYPYGACQADPGFPSGYCTVWCGTGEATCPAGSECVAFQAASACLDTCTGSSDCRGGYECKNMGGTAALECFP